MIRPAGECDFSAIRAIYGEYIETSVTFEYALPSEEAYAARLAAIRAAYPLLVADEDGHLVGFAYAHCPFERAAYAWNAELSIYLSRQARGMGYGTLLYACMLSILRLQNVQVALACITYPNEASMALHRKFGFTQAAHFAKAGYKMGAWHDVVWQSLDLCPHFSQKPKELVPFPSLEEETVRRVIAEETGRHPVHATQAATLHSSPEKGGGTWWFKA